MQGYSLAVLFYGIEVLHINKRLKVAHHDVIQSWYTGGSVALGILDKIVLYFNLIK